MSCLNGKLTIEVLYLINAEFFICICIITNVKLFTPPVALRHNIPLYGSTISLNSSGSKVGDIQ